MNRLHRWWHRRQQSTTAIQSRMDRIEQSVEQLARQLTVHALATDTRLSIYDVLIPKTLADLSASLREIAVAQQRLADIWEERRAPKSDAPLSVAIHHERRA